jgi:hypothetical protein
MCRGAALLRQEKPFATLQLEHRAESADIAAKAGEVCFQG